MFVRILWLCRVDTVMYELLSDASATIKDSTLEHLNVRYLKVLFPVRRLKLLLLLYLQGVVSLTDIQGISLTDKKQRIFVSLQLFLIDIFFILKLIICYIITQI